MVLLISYDLNGRERPASYTAVREMIERHAISSIKPLYSQWFVQTNDSPETWSARMQNVADATDSWFVCPVRRPYQGWLPRSVWEWVEERA